MLIFNSPWLLIGDLITEISKWQISFILFYILPSWCRIEFQLWFIRSEVLKVLFTIKALEPDVSPVCLICSTTRVRAAKLTRLQSWLSPAYLASSVYTKSLSWHNFGQNISNISIPNYSSRDFHMYMSLFLRRESVVLFSWPNSKNLWSGGGQLTHFICLHSVLYLYIVASRNTHGVELQLPLNPMWE